MDIIKMARELGAAIQQDERYLNFKKAVRQTKPTSPSTTSIGELNLIQMKLSAGRRSKGKEPAKGKN